MKCEERHCGAFAHLWRVASSACVCVERNTGSNALESNLPELEDESEPLKEA
jgi:hypothetical protein